MTCTDELRRGCNGDATKLMLQAVLISDETCPSAETLPAELRELQERLVGETKRQLDETRARHEELIACMRQQFEQQLDEARKQQDAREQADK
jgi:exonuclease VII large subunit